MTPRAAKKTVKRAPRKRAVKQAQPAATSDVELSAEEIERQVELAVSTLRAERLRQIACEGHMPHDDAQLFAGQLALAAAAYTFPPGGKQRQPRWTRVDGKPTLVDAPSWWPFDLAGWKPTPDDRIRELTKAGALILAELERLYAIAFAEAATDA